MSMRFPSRASLRVVNLVALAVAVALSALPAYAVEVHRFDIPEEPASAAIRDFGFQAHVQILVAGDNVEGKKLHAVRGSLSTEEALNKLLSGTGLTHKYVGDGAIALLPIGDPDPPGSGTASTSQLAKGEPESAGTFLLAQATSRQTAGTSSVGGGASEGSVLEEVVVSAQKKTELLQQVPVPVTAVDAEALMEVNQLGVEDYVYRVPGLSVTNNGQNVFVTIRGISTGSYVNPKVGIVIDDVPFGASTQRGGGLVTPDLDPNDLSRVEILRGPQGTLYGADSMGGLIKYVTVDPSTAETSGRVQLGADGVSHGVQAGWNVRAAANVALSDDLAIRASGFQYAEPGYIENVQTGEKGFNDQRVGGGRLAAIWSPSEDFSAKLSAIYQHFTAYGTNAVNTNLGLGDLQTENIPGTRYDRILQAYSATLSAKLGVFDLTSVTGYNDIQSYPLLDESPSFGGLSQLVFGPSASAALGTDDRNFHRITEELRFSGPIGGRVDFLLGGFFSNESGNEFESVQGAYPSGESAGLIIGEYLPSNYQEYAVFGDLTFRVTDQFDVQIGGRESKFKGNVQETFTGPLAPPSYPLVDLDDNAFTYLFTPRYKLTSNLMIYARLASGYGAGGINPTPGVPPTFGPDKTKNYELGGKGDFFDRRLSVDLSIYRIDYTDIQLSFTQPVTDFAYNGNGTSARSQGIELSVKASPLKGFSVDGWVAYDDAKLTEDFAPGTAVAGLEGDRLPLSSKISGSVSLEQAFPIHASTSGYAGATASYVGDRLGPFNTTGTPRQDYAGYAKFDATAGVRFATWTANIFVNNIGDKRAINGGGAGLDGPGIFYFIQPRTYGLNLVKTF
jgi:iron complex outermembrane recepter protein